MGVRNPFEYLRPIFVAAGIAALLAGCTRTSLQAGSRTSSTGLHPWTHPNELRAAMTGNVNTLNPILATQELEAQVYSLIFDPLIATRADGVDVPMLASRVPTLENGDIGKDGRTITYHLRSGVVWQDGAPFSSRDVVFSWRAVMNPNTAVSTRHGYDIIASIDTPDATTAVIHLKAPFAPFVHTFFAHSDSPYDILPEHLLAKYHDLTNVPFNSAPIGTGPYRLTRWARADRFQFAANPTYFLGKPAIASIIIHIVPDENTVAAEMRAHDLDWFISASPRVYRQLQNIDGVKIDLVSLNGYDAIQFNTHAAPFDDARLRRAVGLAIDKPALVRDVTYDTTVPAREDIPAFMWASDPHAGSNTRDLPGANALLTSAGWTPGADGIRTRAGHRLVLEIAYRSDSLTDRNRGVVIAAMLKDAGIDAQLKGYTTALLYGSYAGGGIMATGKYDAALTTWYAGIDPDDSTQLLCTQFPPAGLNWSRYCNPALDAAERIALTSYDQATRKRAYAKIQTALALDAPYVYLWWPRQIEAYNDDVQHFAPNGIVEDWNAYAWRFGPTP